MIALDAMLADLEVLVNTESPSHEIELLVESAAVLSKIMLERAKANEKITILTNTAPTEVEGAPTVSGLRLRDTVTGEESKLAVTGVFVAIGHDPRSNLVRGQVELDDAGRQFLKKNTVMGYKQNRPLPPQQKIFQPLNGI